jgi:hypothetical protein
MVHERLRRAAQTQLLLSFGLLVHGSALAWLAPEAFTDWIREDGPVESLTAVTLGGSACFAWALALRYRALDRTKARTWWLLGCVLLFGAMEEISWGQRIFGWESPEWFQLHNAQAETNLHNLRFHGIKLNKWVFGKGLALVLLLYVGILPLLYPRVARVRARIDALALPLARGRLVLVYLGALALVRIPLSLLADSRAMEMGEMVGAAVFFSLLCDPVNPPSIAVLEAFPRQSEVTFT